MCGVAVSALDLVILLPEFKSPSLQNFFASGAHFPYDTCSEDIRISHSLYIATRSLARLLALALSPHYEMTFSSSQRLLFLYTLSSLISETASQCDDNGVTYANGDKWVRNNHFLVTCRGGKIQVRIQLFLKFQTFQTLKCVTDSGNLLDVGSKTHVEHGYEYTCSHEASTDQLNTNSCPTFADFSDDIFKDRFAICCISRRFKGCVDFNGDIVKHGFFIIGNRSLKYCKIQADQLMARIEPRG